MQILHVIRGLTNSSGTTHIVGPLAEAQARLGHTVRLFFVDKAGHRPVVPDPTLVEARGFPMTVPTEHAGWSRPFAQALPGALREADVVHIHAIWNFPTWWAMRAASRAGIPYVVAPQGSLEDWALNRSRRLKAIYAKTIERPYFNRALAMQALTETEAAQCRRFGITAPVAVLPNGVDLALIDRARQPRDLRREFSLPANSVVFLFLGRVFPKKGLDLLIRAFARLVNNGADACLLIAGHDAGTGYGHQIEQLIHANGVTERIRLIGEVAGDDKFATFRAADAFVLSSYSEGLPVAVLEAMGCGLPVVITRNCNVPEVEESKSGWVVNTSVDSLLEGLRHACACAQERQARGRNARRLVVEKFTWTRIANESLGIYGSSSRHMPLPVGA